MNVWCMLLMNKRCLQLSNLECSSLRGLMLFIRNFKRVIFTDFFFFFKEEESNYLSNGEDALVEGMAGREPGRTSSLTTVVGGISVPSLALSRSKLSTAKHHKSPMHLAGRDIAADRHRQTRPVAETVLKMGLLLSRRLRVPVGHFREGASMDKHGSTLTFHLSPGVPRAHSTSQLLQTIRRGDLFC